MSMISAQIDELRNTAEFYDGFKAANLMRDAADTIWQLRDDLQRTNAENAKLRELVRELWIYAKQELDCDWTCSYSAVCDWKDCVFMRRMHELGVEVNE